jgi:tetratricopeptide (TPR) repeat protein
VRTAKPDQWEKLFAEALALAKEAVARDATSAPSYSTLGEILEAQGHWADAVAAFDRALTIDKSYAEAWQRRGICYLELFSEAMMDAQWRSQKAEQVIAILLAPGPRAVECRKQALESLKRYSELRTDATESVEYRYAQVAAMIVAGKFIDADQASDKLLAEVQTDERVWLLKAASQIGRMNFGGAAATLTRLIEDVAPQLWRPYFVRGWIRLVQKSWDRALVDLTRAIELDPRQARVYAVRASVYLGKENREAAEKDYDRAIELLPTFGFVWTTRAATKLHRGDARGAIEDATRGMELEPAESSGPFVRAQGKWRMGDLRGALEDADLAIKLGPKDPDNYTLRCHLRNGAGNHEGALADATKVVQLAPKDVSGWRLRSSLKWNLNDKAGALEDLTRAVDAAPDDAEVHYLRGWHRLHAGDAKGALEDAELGMDLDSKAGKHWALRGRVRLGQNDLRGALDDFRKAGQLTPSLGSDLAPLIDQCQKKLGDKK